MPVPISDREHGQIHIPTPLIAVPAVDEDDVTVVELGCELDLAAPRHLDQRHNVWQITSSPRKLPAGPQSGVRRLD
jgi:hypothetical protein